ncbi:hypothetical protein H310_11222 [Aphanomyces invadans]|uniref:DDE Tnp4 domain-containing protein n=1 Tax=Aphanomyces invadans TaxID=157072 RepID=A0A024TMF6_9STRA|nr:hypothetical protein H310_11222 [Aphanomyces invadans]ETV95325.1 hypothetical protein H310_11222 [Aphanomyces invadans]|eukprot:XP_008876026.1 hypothetical protein H310_11222 [Aphanomyces invadans]
MTGGNTIFAQKGAMLENIFGFIDGSKIETCRISRKKRP